MLFVGFFIGFLTIVISYIILYRLDKYLFDGFFHLFAILLSAILYLPLVSLFKIDNKYNRLQARLR
jgi:hypothetical protein